MKTIKTSWFNYKNSIEKSNCNIGLQNKIKENIINLPALKIINDKLALKKTIENTNSFMNKKKNLLFLVLEVQILVQEL